MLLFLNFHVHSDEFESVQYIIPRYHSPHGTVILLLSHISLSRNPRRLIPAVFQFLHQFQLSVSEIPFIESEYTYGPIKAFCSLYILTTNYVSKLGLARKCISNRVVVETVIKPQLRELQPCIGLPVNA